MIASAREHAVRRALLEACFIVSLTASASAETIAVSNAGFEAPSIPAGTFATTSAPPGWAGYGNLNFSNRTIGVLDPTTTSLYPAGAPEGQNVGVVFLMDDFANQGQFANQEAGLQQSLATPTASATHYVLRVRVGNIGNDPNPPHSLFQFTGFPGYRIDLLAGDALLATETNGSVPGEGQFVERTLVATTLANDPRAGSPLVIRLVDLNAAVGIEVNFDDVRLDSFAAATWTDLGHAKPGGSGTPSLAGSGPMIVGSMNQLALTQAAPSSIAHLIFGVSALHAPFFGGTLVPSPQIVVALPTPPTGALVLPFVWPPGLPPATALYFQYWIVDPTAPGGLSASNALTAVAP